MCSMRSNLAWMVTIACLAVPGLAQSTGEPADAKTKAAIRSAQPKPAPAAESDNADRAPAARQRPAPLPVRFQATVFQVEIPADQLTALDARTLATQAKTAVSLETALKGLGATK